MKYLKSFMLFWYHFIIGDDWKLACGAALGIGLSFLAVHTHHRQAWEILPIVVLLTLSISFALAVRRNKTSQHSTRKIRHAE